MPCTIESEMTPQPKDRMEGWRASGKLQGKRAVVTGGDSGIGRAVAIGFAKEGADVVIPHSNAGRFAPAVAERLGINADDTAQLAFEREVGHGRKMPVSRAARQANVLRNCCA